MLYLYIIDKIYINSIDEENVTNQTCTATDYRPSYHGNRKRDTSLRMYDFARTVQNFGLSCVKVQPSHRSIFADPKIQVIDHFDG